MLKHAREFFEFCSALLTLVVQALALRRASGRQRKWNAALGAAALLVWRDRGAGWRARGEQRWRVIICRRGVVWITQERDAVDYVLQEGEVFIVTLPGLVLLQAMEPASVTIVTPSVSARLYAGDFRAFR